MDILRELGPLAYASRLKRLSERLMHDVSKAYELQNTDFEARWFPIAYMLLQRSPLGVTEIAEALGYTHPAISQIAGEMAKHGLIRSSRHSGDGRRHMLALTAKGRATLNRVRPLWNAVRRCTQDLLDESGHDVLSAIEAVECSLDRMDMLTRLRNHLRPTAPNVEIVAYRPEYKRAFRTLNLEWLGQIVPLEHHDRRVLNHPDSEILKPGGQILFARVKRAIVGTTAITSGGSGTYEITKMAVSESWRGAGIGRLLATSAIEWARRNGASEIRVATSPKFTEALALYRSLGFVPTRPDSVWRTKYRRRTVFFRLPEININSKNQEKHEP